MNSDLIKKQSWELIGQCEVDSGQIMLVDPCYILNKEDYQSLIDHRNKSGLHGFLNFTTFKKGIVVDTWGGDGDYHVYIQKDKDGRVERLMIDFTTSYGSDSENPNYHDIEMQLLLTKMRDNYLNKVKKLNTYLDKLREE